ncbi:MAG TPA: ASCH domain-containing protein [Candidatus Saccharimonadales bacterium]|nr:ASCH domain-containing protein [Candidatus Saccharimonadales bacterium]
MTHYSQIADGPFQQIKRGERLIEPRLNDDAHRKIRPGDLLIITNRTTGEEVVAKVVGVLRYPSFVELLQAYPAERFGVQDERDMLTEMKQYYTSEQEIAHGVLGIKLHLLKGKTSSH